MKRSIMIVTVAVLMLVVFGCGSDNGSTENVFPGNPSSQQDGNAENSSEVITEDSSIVSSKLIEPVLLSTYEHYGYGGVFAFEGNFAYALNYFQGFLRLEKIDMSGAIPVIVKARNHQAQAGIQLEVTKKIGNYIFLIGNKSISTYNATTLELVNYSAMTREDWDVSAIQNEVFCIYSRQSHVTYFVPIQDLPIFNEFYQNSMGFSSSGEYNAIDFVAFHENLAYVFTSAHRYVNNVGKVDHLLYVYNWKEQKVIKFIFLQGASYGYMNRGTLVGVHNGKIYYIERYDDGNAGVVKTYDIATETIVTVLDLHEVYYPPYSYNGQMLNDMNHIVRLWSANIVNNHLFVSFEGSDQFNESSSTFGYVAVDLNGEPKVVLEKAVTSQCSVDVDGNNLFVSTLARLEVYRIFE